MPSGDRTGPAGLGPMTGRGAGYCAGYPVPGYMNPGPGGGYSGYGRGFGGGGARRGHRYRYYATGLPGRVRAAAGTPVPEAGYYGPAGTEPVSESEALERERDFLKQGLQRVEERLKELEKETGKGK